MMPTVPDEAGVNEAMDETFDDITKTPDFPGKVGWVAQRNGAEVKESTGPISKTLGIVPYGTQVDVIQQQGDRVEIQSTNPPISGWIFRRDITSRRIVNDGSSASTSASEVAFGGKG